MGEGITVECTSCDYTETFWLGIGFMYSSLENVIFLVSKSRQDDVLNILQNENVYDVTYEHKLFICPKCHHLASRFDYAILYNDNKVYQPYFRCSECRTKLVPVEEPVENIPCPICSRKSLTQFASIMWD